jgi:hypothetical protein
MLPGAQRSRTWWFIVWVRVLLLEYLLPAIGMYGFANLIREHNLLGSVRIVLFHLLVGKGNNLQPIWIP